MLRHVTVEYADDGKPLRVDTVVLSTQHAAEIGLEQIRQDILEKLSRQRSQLNYLMRKQNISSIRLDASLSVVHKVMLV